jgi:signal transduction histidine kinase
VKPKSLIILLVIIQVSVIVGSFGSILMIDIAHDDFADYVHISEKNVFYTAFLLHESDEYSKGLLGVEEINHLFEEFEENILLLKNGGEYLGHEIDPLSEKYQSDVNEIHQEFLEFKNIVEEFEVVIQNGEDPSDEYYIKHEQIEIKLIENSEALTNAINIEFDEAIKSKEMLEVALIVANVVVYVSTIYVMLRTLQREAQEMKKLQKLYTIGQMSSRIAHDLRNPLTVIKGSIDFLEKTSSDEKAIERYSRMQCSIKDMYHIIEDVLEFARAKELKVTKEKLSQILKDSLSTLNIPDEVKVELPQEDIELECDIRKIQAIIVNLLVNSLDAMKNKGTLTIKLENESKDVKIHIIDSGPGIPEDILPKIFEPLFTSKSTGTGLGLGISKTIVEQHNGKITVSNNPTTFTIQLPKP